MRILLLHSSSDMYGASKIFLQTTTILQKRGSVLTVVLSSDGPLAEKIRNLGLEVYIINLGIIRRKYFTPLGVFNRIQKWRVGYKALNTIVEKHGIEIVYSNTAAVIIGLWLKNKNKGSVKHIWHIHEIIESPKLLHNIIKWLMIKKADTIIAVSNAVKNSWAAGNNQLENKIQVIYNGIETLEATTEINFKQQYAIQANAIVIGMAGRIHYWKGQDYFLKIAKAIIEERNNSMNPAQQNIQEPPVYFLITGDAYPGYEYLLSKMQNYIANNNLGTNVIYTGFEPDMHRFYASIDILVLPSQQPDPLPTVVLEAMHFGIPVVATPQGGALEMIQENETGIFIPMQEEALAAKKIIAILPKSIRAKMGEKGKERVLKYFSAAAFEKNMLTLFEAHVN